MAIDFSTAIVAKVGSNVYAVAVHAAAIALARLAVAQDAPADMTWANDSDLVLAATADNADIGRDLLNEQDLAVHRITGCFPGVSYTIAANYTGAGGVLSTVLFTGGTMGRSAWIWGGVA